MTKLEFGNLVHISMAQEGAELAQLLENPKGHIDTKMISVCSECQEPVREVTRRIQGYLVCTACDIVLEEPEQK